MPPCPAKAITPQNCRPKPPLTPARSFRDEDFPGAAGRDEQHAIVIAQDQVLPIHGPISHRGGRQRIQDPGIEALRAGIAPRLKTGKPIAWMSAVSRCSPQITIPSSPAA